jgi:ATP-dependent DNA helicase DinG
VGDVAELLASITALLPNGGEARPGQVTMAESVGEALVRGRHLVVQAGTGTGKSLAYLVPVVASGRRTVVATVTKALQDQLAGKDLPLVGGVVEGLSWTVLKGRSNYLCLQRLREATSAAEGRLELDELAPTVRADVVKLAAWAATTQTGDYAELDWSPKPKAWETVSVTSVQCPGATRCPLAEPCFAESARRRAEAADVIVVNTHLYGIDLASGGAILPEHEVLVIDEAHQLEDVLSATLGVSLSASRFLAVAGALARVLEEPGLVGDVAGAGNALADVLLAHGAGRLPVGLADAITEALVEGRRRVDAVGDVLRRIEPATADAGQRKLRAQRASMHLVDDIDFVLKAGDAHVAWVEVDRGTPTLQVAPIEIGDLLAATVWSKRTAVLTSATIPAVLPERLGMPPDTVDVLDVGSPFDYERNGLLYCATHLPDPRHASFASAVHEELAALVDAAGGRTLALFTSRRAMQDAAAALAPRLDHRVFTQDDLPKPALVKAFRDDETSCLFATAGFFQGIDIPGDALRLVTIDRIPFPRPDDPLLSARRERAGPAAFRVVDLPRAATLLAQAAGRLIRTATDRGAVAVFDPRLAKAAYRWDLVRALPPMHRTRHRAEAEAFLRSLS